MDGGCEYIAMERLKEVGELKGTLIELEDAEGLEVSEGWLALFNATCINLYQIANLEQKVPRFCRSKC